ncbi:MAG: hypothetical protein LBV47_09985 [Bacteroidales bacterium]|nr:hypothetical protein [Bacteroidales bacterium]
MKTSKFFWNLLMAAALVAPVVLTSCKGDDEGDDPTPPPVESNLSGSVANAKTLDASVAYTLDGPLIVEDGGVLDIPAGTTIKAKKGFSSYILVLQGGKINVNGTASDPVRITSGETAPQAGDWGGLIINGRAPLAGGTTGSTEINSAYTYGGTAAADNSGTITYLILEYTGARSSADVEHNGLTLNGVGSGTTIENIYIPYGSDDGIEFFGGSVNVKNLLVVNSDDDMFDMTQGWNGTLENNYGIWETGYSSTESDASGVEADGNFDGNFPDHQNQSNFTIRNMTIDLRLAASDDPTQQMNNVLKIRRGAKANIINALVKGTGSVKSAGAVIDMTDGKGNGDVTSAVSITNQLTSNPAGYKFGADAFPNVKLESGSSGCAASVFAWTGYNLDEQPGNDPQAYFGTYYSADFHNHTGYSDGTNPITFVLNQGYKYGLDVIVNSEHGGRFAGNASDGDTEGPVPSWTDSGLANLISGTDSVSGQMWRWQSIKDYSFPKVVEFNARRTTTIAVQGLEWNPPGHEHASTGIITNQFITTDAHAKDMAQFEYMFDNNDKDEIGGAKQGWVKSTKTDHEKSMEAAAWMQANHRLTSWIVPAHPERQDRWKIEHYRDMNDVAPDVFVAFESIPGHQASPQRGGYGNTNSYEKTYTFGGVGVQTAAIGNVWDAMISEGRRFWIVANSDFHNHVTKNAGDFYPGEYQKTFIEMKAKTAQGFVDGLRAGNIYTVHGNLIDRLEFSVGSATMGQTFNAANKTVKVRILVSDPQSANANNTYTALTNPELNHIDLIAGKMRPKVTKGSADYSNGTYNDVKVIARFDATGGVKDGNGITSTAWKDMGNGLRQIEYTVQIEADTYFRLRGTNHGLNVSGETDENGNPLVDTPAADVHTAAASAFDDLWFYSNPVFVNLQ